MQIIVDTYNTTGELHHAYCLVGHRETIFSKITNFIEKHLKIPARGNPDVWSEHFDLLGIEASRFLIEAQNKMPLGKKKIFIISICGITHEAQNALLKMLEEPKSDTHFFLIVSTPDVFIPTVKSRMIFVTDDFVPESSVIVKKFLKSSPKDRIESLDFVIENKDRKFLSDFLDSLVVEIHNLAGKNLDKMNNVLEEILKCRSYIQNRAPGFKMIIEHLALIIPIIK